MIKWQIKEIENNTNFVYVKVFDKYKENFLKELSKKENKNIEDDCIYTCPVEIYGINNCDEPDEDAFYIACNSDKLFDEDEEIDEAIIFISKDRTRTGIYYTIKDEFTNGLGEEIVGFEEIVDF